MNAVRAAMERAVGETALELESQMILLATAVSGAPFLGLLGTVWGVMDTFTDVAVAGSPNLATMAPGVSGALYHHRDRALRRHPGDVRLQFFGHEHSRNDRANG